MATTFDDLILRAEAKREEEKRRRVLALESVKLIHGKAADEGRALSDDEHGAVKEHMATHARAEKAEQAALDNISELKQARAAEARADDELDKRAANAGVTQPKLHADQTVKIGSEERVYNLGQGNGNHQRAAAVFLQDVVQQFLYRNIDAEMRLQRHMQEERVERGQYLKRAVGTGAFAGLTVPQYLTAFYAPAVAARRPFADAMTKLPLPEQGMTVNISRITTASSVALQANQADAVSETNMDDTLLTENVQTAAGQQTLSRQAIDRGAGIEDVVMQDLQRRYAANLDSTILTQGTTGLGAVGTAITHDDTTPTVAETYPKIFQALAASEIALLGQAHPDIVVMHSRRWAWFQNALVSTHPLIAQQGFPAESGGLNLATRYGSGFRGVLPNGTAVIVDNNLPINLGGGTNQDEIHIVPTEESYLWEDPNAPQFIRAEQTAAATLGVLLVLYGYFAYTLRRYSNSHQRITGTGLVTPTYTGV